MLPSTTADAMPADDHDDLDRLLERLAWKAQIPHLVLGVLLLVIGVGLLFLAFALLIRVRSGQLREALHASSPRVRAIRLQTRQVGPLGITALTTVFAIVDFDAASGARRTLRLQGKARDLAALVAAIERACPSVRIDDPETVRVHVG